jgi:hypothetical protein
MKYTLFALFALLLAAASASREAVATEPHDHHHGHDHGHGAAEAQPESMPSVPDPAVQSWTDEGRGHFGAPLQLDGAALSLEQALETCVDTGAPCKIEATIESVCQNRGCWFTLVAPGVTQPVRVRMQDYGFFVPRDATGAHCTLEGTLSTEVIPQDVAQHYADEAVAPGETPRQVEGPETIYSILITGVELRR